MQPETVGLPGNGHRRTPGLRREEVAQLAGVGLSWYTWLEQGRDITPSPSVLDALARVFDLEVPERAHLFALAGVAVPVSAGPYPTEAPPELERVVAGLVPNPAYLLGPRTDVLAWNEAATAMLGTPATAPDGRVNLLWWLFTAGGTHRQGWSDTARLTLARFRAEHARRYGDESFTQLIRALQAASPRFRELWRRHEVLDAQIGTKVIEHPRLGRLEVHHLQSIPTSHPDLRLIQFVPADRATRAALAAVWADG
jgi:transcriptional regulator with XRE-family HTH domain